MYIVCIHWVFFSVWWPSDFFDLTFAVKGFLCCCTFALFFSSVGVVGGGGGGWGGGHKWMGFLNTQPSHFYCLYIRVTYSRLGVLFVSTLSVTVWSGTMFVFFLFFFFFLTCLIHAPLCLRLYPGRSGGEQWAVNVFWLSYSCLQGSLWTRVLVGCWGECIYTRIHMTFVSMYVVWMLPLPSVGLTSESPRANFAPRTPSCLLPSFDPTTFSHISSHPP